MKSTISVTTILMCMLAVENEACLRMRYRFRFYHVQREREPSQMDDNFMDMDYFV